MIRIDGLKKVFGARTLFEGATFHFPEGERIALVGANGAGKTTLLNIICSLDSADDGHILIPSSVKVGYLPQKPNAYPEATVLAECVAGSTRIIELQRQMEVALAAASSSSQALQHYEAAESAFRLAGGYALEARAMAILRGLGFAESDLTKPPSALSGGMRMRLELARLFIREPEFLILDEPTNHLDLPSLVWVENFLKSFKGTLLFVSHDRALLNRLATITLHLFGGRLTPYKGNFDKFLEAREQRLAEEAATAEQLRRRREAMESFVTRFGAKASKASQAQSRVKMIARLKDLEEGFQNDDEDASVSIVLPEPPKTPRIVYAVEDGCIGYDKPLAKSVNLSIERGHRIAIIGANGIGKSTLLKTIAGHLKLLGGQAEATNNVTIAYFAQDQMDLLRGEDTVLGSLLRLSDLSEKAARSLLGSFLFRKDDVFKSVSVLSGGELSRLGLAIVLSRRAGLLLLDEPTNHLDMSSVETLADGLANYTGTALFVSHDRTFIDAVATHIFAMLPDGRSMLFEGQLDHYEKLAQIAGFPNVLAPELEKTNLRDKDAKEQKGPSADIQAKDLKRQKQRLQNKITQLEKDIEKLRSDLLRLEITMAATDPADYLAMNSLHQQQEQKNAALEELEAEWLISAEELETAVSELTAIGRL